MTQNMLSIFNPESAILGLYRSSTSAETYGVSVQTIYKWAKMTKRNLAITYTNNNMKNFVECA